MILIFNEFIPVKPVPASRPRVTGWGTYYTKTYMDFRNEMKVFLNKIKNLYPPSEGEFLVKIEFICRKPKKPENEYPVGDIDNYLKSPLDSFTSSGMFWNDDVQVIEITGTKRYQEKDEPFGMKVEVWKK